MNNPNNLIKERNLDPSLIKLIRGTSGEGNADIKEDIANLKSTKAEKSVLINYFNKYTDKLSQDMMADALSNKINEIDNKLNKTDYIAYNNLHPDLRTKIDNIENAANSGSASESLNAEISILDSKISTNTANITNTTDSLNNYIASNDNTIKTINDDVKDNKDSINDIIGIINNSFLSGEEDKKITMDDFSEELKEILQSTADMQSSLENLTENSALVLSSQYQKGMPIVHIERGKLGETLLVGKDTLIGAYIARDETTLGQLRSQDLSPIIDLVNGEVLGIDLTKLRCTFIIDINGSGLYYCQSGLDTLVNLGEHMRLASSLKNKVLTIKL